jgi:hypothetical protein
MNNLLSLLINLRLPRHEFTAQCRCVTRPKGWEPSSDRKQKKLSVIFGRIFRSRSTTSSFSIFLHSFWRQRLARSPPPNISLLISLKNWLFYEKAACEQEKIRNCFFTLRNVLQFFYSRPKINHFRQRVCIPSKSTSKEKESQQINFEHLTVD